MSKHKKHKQYKPDENNNNKTNPQYNPQYNPQLNNMGLDRLVGLMGNIDINRLAELLNNFGFNNDNNDNVGSINQNNNMQKETVCKKDVNEYINNDINEDVKYSEYKDVNYDNDKNNSTVLANNEGIMISEDKIKKLLLALKNIADEKTSRDLQKLLELYLSK